MLPPDNYKLMLFDVTSLSLNVPLDYAFDINLKRIYDQRELERKISRKEMKDLLLLVPKTYIFLMIINFILKRMVLQWGHTKDQ